MDGSWIWRVRVRETHLVTKHGEPTVGGEVKTNGKSSDSSQLTASQF